jgi:hypothetical protein
MRKRLFIMASLLLFAASAWGSPCMSTAFSNYLGAGFSCTEGDFLFSHFSYSASDNLPPATAVNVVPTSDANDVGFDFYGAWQSGGGVSSDAVIAYEISTVDKAPLLLGDTISLVSYGASGTGANVQIVEGACTAMPSNTGACPKGDEYPLDAFYNSSGKMKQSDSATFTTPSSAVWLSKNVITNSSYGSAAISEFENTSQTNGGGGTTGGGPSPEPGSLLTLGSGLVATSLLLRKRRRKA